MRVIVSDVKNRISRPVRLRLSEKEQTRPALIEYCLKHAKATQLRHRTLRDYYNNETAIQRRVLADPDKPNNRVSHAVAKYITKVSTAYFMGNGVRCEAPDEGYKQALDDIFSENMSNIRHFEEAQEMSRQGIAFELLYIDPENRLRTQFFGADEIIPVFSANVGRFLFMALRPYQSDAIEEIGKVHYVDIYTQSCVEVWRRYMGSSWQLVERFSHGFTDIPVIVRMNNADLKGDYEDIITQIDAYDKAQSDTLNDLDYFSDAYLVTEGIDGLVASDESGEEMDPQQTARLMKQERLISTPEGSKIYFVTKNSNDGPAENYKNRVYRDMFTLSLVPNLTDEDFAGNLSGVAIKYKLFGLEELSTEKETYFTSSELKKIRLMTEYLNTLHGTTYDWRTVTLKFDRSAIANTLEIAQIMNMLRDILSDETLIGMYPEVVNAAEELERRQKEENNKENHGIPPPDDGVF